MIGRQDRKLYCRHIASAAFQMRRHGPLGTDAAQLNHRRPVKRRSQFATGTPEPAHKPGTPTSFVAEGQCFVDIQPRQISERLLNTVRGLVDSPFALASASEARFGGQ